MKLLAALLLASLTVVGCGDMEGPVVEPSELSQPVSSPVATMSACASSGPLTTALVQWADAAALVEFNPRQEVDEIGAILIELHPLMEAEGLEEPADRVRAAVAEIGQLPMNSDFESKETRLRWLVATLNAVVPMVERCSDPNALSSVQQAARDRGEFLYPGIDEDG